MTVKKMDTNLVHVNFPDNPHKTGSLLKVLNVKVGARVTVTTNIDVTDGLTNGAIDSVTNVLTIQKKII